LYVGISVKTMKARRMDIDGGYAWVVMIASTLSLVLNGSLLYGVGILHVAFLSHFKESDSYTSFVGSVFSSILQLIGECTIRNVLHV
jgi:hypothetical protein